MAYYKKDQLSIRTRSKLADYFADLILITQSVQSFRTALASTQFFNGIELFRQLDRDQKGYLTPKDFSYILSDNVKKILHYAFGWFDVSKVGQITRAQFLQFLFPRQNQALRELISLRMTQQQLVQQKKATIPMQMDLLRKLILQIMQKQTRLIPIRRSLMDQDDYSLKGVMNALDVQNRGWITVDDLYKFIKNYDIDVSKANVCALLNVYDNDMNGKISIEELDWLVEGLQRSDGYYRNIVRNSDRIVRSKRLNSCCTCKKSRTNQSQQKRRKSHKKLINTTNKKNVYDISGKKLKLSTKEERNLKKKIEFSGQKNKKQNKNKGQQKQNHKMFQRSSNEKSKRKKGQKIQNQSIQYQSIKRTYKALQKQTEQIDQQLIRYQQQMGAQTQLQMKKCLEDAIIKRRLKLQQQQRLRQRLQELQLIRKEQQLKRIKQAEMQRLREIEQNRLLQIQLQKNRIQVQRNRIRELQIAQMRQVQSRVRRAELQKLRLIELERSRQKQIQIKLQASMEQRRLRSIERMRQTQAIENARIRERLQKQIYDRQVKMANQRGIRLLQTQFDWKSQAKLKQLFQRQDRSRSANKQRFLNENDYFERYSNYRNHLAEVADPLGIKQHLAQTDKYLQRSKQLRDQIKKDRTNSLNKYAQIALNKSKVSAHSRFNTLTDDKGQKTPQQLKDMRTSNKRTAQTKLVWSNN